MQTYVINIEQYLPLNLTKGPNFLFASHVKFLTTVIRLNFIANISLKTANYC